MRAATLSLFVCLAAACSSPDGNTKFSGPHGTECGHGAIDADPHNCGDCGHDCTTLPGVLADSVRCVQGSCVADGACQPGRAHCSSNPDDGCEANLSSPATCGACGTSCSNGKSCAAGGTNGFQCQSGCGSQTDCSGQCADLTSDGNNCGACGNACLSPSNGSNSCTAGACVVTCDTGFDLVNGACVSSGMMPPGGTTTGGTWSPQTSGTTNALYSVWGSTTSDIFITGDRGTILTESGAGNWDSIPSSTRNVIVGVWDFDADNVVGVGWNRSGGGFFLPQPDGSWAGGGSLTVGVNGVWGSDADANIFAVGDSGTILHSTDFITWRIQSVSTSQSLWAVRGTSGQDVYAAGDRGTIVYNDGTGWSKQTSGISTSLFGLWATATDVWAVGAGGVILHSTGTDNWSPETSGSTDNLNSVVAVGADAWAVGENGTILHRAAGVWSADTSGTTEELWGVWGSATDGVFAVGDNGTILHR